jgi:hypothetical protein
MSMAVDTYDTLTTQQRQLLGFELPSDTKARRIFRSRLPKLLSRSLFLCRAIFVHRAREAAPILFLPAAEMWRLGFASAA